MSETATAIATPPMTVDDVVRVLEAAIKYVRDNAEKVSGHLESLTGMNCAAMMSAYAPHEAGSIRMEAKVFLAPPVETSQ